MLKSTIIRCPRQRKTWLPNGVSPPLLELLCCHEATGLVAMRVAGGVLVSSSTIGSSSTSRFGRIACGREFGAFSLQQPPLPREWALPRPRWPQPRPQPSFAKLGEVPRRFCNCFLFWLAVSFLQKINLRQGAGGLVIEHQRPLPGLLVCQCSLGCAVAVWGHLVFFAAAGCCC